MGKKAATLKLVMCNFNFYNPVRITFELVYNVMKGTEYFVSL
jgi:hypothetical protein